MDRLTYVYDLVQTLLLDTKLVVGTGEVCVVIRVWILHVAVFQGPRL